MMELRDQLQGTLGAAYSLERELGGGGMSHVFVATETALGRTVVVKVLPPDLVGGVNVDRFRREVRLAAQLQHPHIVPLLSAGEMDGVPYYTMPFVEGQSLRARLTEAGALPLTEALGILRDVAKALAYAHGHDVVHRDIKPDNVLLSGGVAVVTDFGIAKALSSSATAKGRTSITMTGTSIGTPAYMAPEQAAADPASDHRADIYSFGCMAYELFTGEPPFAGVPAHKRLLAQISEMPPPISDFRPDVPRQLEELVARCLEKDPADRPQRASELAEALDSAVARHSTQLAVPTALLVPVVLGKALMLYVAAAIAVLLLTQTAVTYIGLPDWVLAGAMIIMALGLPVVLVTGWVHYITRRAASEPPTNRGTGPPVTGRPLVMLAERAGPHLTWRRTTRGGLAALGLFVLVVSGFMAMRALGIGPPGSLLAAGRLKERDRLLVGDFRISGGDSSLGRVVTEAVRTGLSQSPLFSIMSPTSIAAALRRMQRPPTAWVDLELARDIAQREGAKAVVIGDVNPLASGYVVTVRLVAADSGTELASFHETADGPHELLPTVDKLTRHLRGKAGESLRNVHADPPLEQVTTSSLDALRKYVEGSRASDLSDFETAIPALTAAIGLDTGFAMAYRKLAAAYGNAFYPRAMRDSMLTKAYRYRDRLTERERGRLVGDYFTAGPGRDRAKGIAAYEALLVLYPDDQAGLNNLGTALETRREFARAESLFIRVRALDPKILIFHYNLLGVLIEQGKLDEAGRAADELRRRFPTAGPNSVQNAALYYARGDDDSAHAVLEQMARSRSPADRAIASLPLAGFALAHGRLQEASALRAERSALNAARGAPTPALEDSLAATFLDIWFREQPERGVRRMEAALERMPIRSLAIGTEPYVTVTPGYQGNTPYFAVATQYALANRPERARATLTQYDADVHDSTLRRFLEPARQNALGEIALAERRPAEALAAFRRGDQRSDGPASTCGSCPMVRLARAFDQANAPDSATVYFERYLGHYGPFRFTPENDGVFLGGIYKRLGELYEAKGDRAKAAAYYRKFVALWKTADPELQPKVSEVQRRLARVGVPDG